MGKYLKMASWFPEMTESQTTDYIYDGGIGYGESEAAAHAVNSHDELVAEVERLKRQLIYAFMAGWEEGVNGMEFDEAEAASIEIAEQLAKR